jgi:hypothetical protein
VGTASTFVPTNPPEVLSSATRVRTPVEGGSGGSGGSGTVGDTDGRDAPGDVLSVVGVLSVLGVVAPADDEEPAPPPAFVELWQPVTLMMSATA